MKTLIVVRHAKSSWDDFSIDDIDRPLNDRGKKDAPTMGKRLREKIKKIDAFISSPAKRAKKTASLFMKEFEEDPDDLTIEQQLYPGGVGAFYGTIANIADKHDTVALFSHNPGVTDFVNTLTNHRIDNMPTCSVFAVRSDIKHWKDFKDAKHQLLLLDYPKKEHGD
jgi:phosphohistidine phosphatase